MTIRNVVILLLVVGALLGAWWLSTQYPVPIREEEQEAPSVEVQGDLTYEEHTDLYAIDITYPDIVDSNAAARVEEIVNEEVARFKNESISIINEQEAARIREQGRPYQLSATYKAYASEGFVSYEFDIYLDTGGAHPNGFFRTVTFDPAGKVWELADLFTDGAPYLPRLSEEAHTRVLAELSRRSGGVTPDMEEGVRLGTAPSPEALQFFYLSNGALHLLFPPYQVAAYAAGSFDIAIPLDELRDILRSEIQ